MAMIMMMIIIIMTRICISNFEHAVVKIFVGSSACVLFVLWHTWPQLSRTVKMAAAILISSTDISHLKESLFIWAEPCKVGINVGVNVGIN